MEKFGQDEKYSPWAPFFADDPQVRAFLDFANEHLPETPGTVINPSYVKIAAKAVMQAFLWNHTPEGHDFWIDVYTRLCRMADPEISEEPKEPTPEEATEEFASALGTALGKVLGTEGDKQ